MNQQFANIPAADSKNCSGPSLGFLSCILNSTPNIPDHTLIQPIGRGAYGEVWLARNAMGVLRAVKLIKRRQFDSDRPYEREFAGIQRYEPVSRSTEGLVHVLHVGRNDAEGYFYYVMELADAVNVADGLPPPSPGSALRPHAAVSPNDPAGGRPADSAKSEPSGEAGYAPRTLRSDLKRLGRLPVSDCLRVGLDVVGGLARLHERSLVHRDVKPANLIFVDGRAKLADIGLVSTESEGRSFVGTEGYIPPEGPGSHLADLYALGMVLYEAVTGYPPERFPKVPPEWFATATDNESLEFHEVVLKACEGAKERRYQSAEEMQADLALLQSGQSVRHLRALEKRVKRWRRIGWAAAISVALAVTIALAANWRARIAAEDRAKEAKLKEQAQKSMVRAESAERESRQQLYAALLEQVRATVRSGELGQRVRALEAVRRAAGISNSVEMRREVVAALTLPDLRFERELPLGSDFTVRQFDPKFERIALGRGSGPIEVHSTQDHRLEATLPPSTNLMAYNAHWSGDGHYLAVRRDHDVAGFGSDLEVWQMPSARRVLLYRDLRWDAMSFHPRQPKLLTAGADGSFVTWDLTEGKALAQGKFDAAPGQLAYSPDGNKVAMFFQRGNGSALSVYSAADAALLTTHLFGNRVYSLAWHPGGRWIAAADASGAVHRMDAQTGETQILGHHQAEAVMTAFSPDGAYLMSGGWERELICWDVSRMQRAFTLGLDAYSMQFRADGRQCAVLAPSGVQLYAFGPPAAHREFAEVLGSRLRHATFSPDGRWLAASASNGLGLWDLAGNGPGAVAEEGAESYCFFTPDSRELFASVNKYDGSQCFRWRVQPAVDPRAPPTLERLPFLKPAGFTFLSLRSNSVVLTATNGSQLLPPESFETSPDRWVKTDQGINRVSPDGRWLGIYRPFSTTLSLYSLPGLERVAAPTHPTSIADFQFSPLGDEVAITSRWGVEFLSTVTWERMHVLTNFNDVLYLPDARSMWLTKDLRSAGLYNTRTLEPLLKLPTGMLPLAITSDGNQLAVSVEMRRLQVWDVRALRAELASLGLDWSSAPP